METKICPQCGEENPAEAVMCWACYTPLIKRGQRRDVTPNEDEPKRTAIKKLGRAISEALPLLLIGAFTASGWLPRRARWPVLGACLATVAGISGAQTWRQRRVTAQIVAQSDPMVRITHELLVYAKNANATAVRLRENGRGGRPSIKIEGEWRELALLPICMWRPMRHWLLQYARNGEVQVTKRLNGTRKMPDLGLTHISADLQAGANGETLELLFEKAPIRSVETLPELLPDVRCQSCRENNALDALWCWNCYAIIEAPRVRQWKSIAAHIVDAAAPLLTLGALCSSGWWPRRIRPFVLGAGALGMAASEWRPLQERLKKIKERCEVAPKTPVVGVAEVIFGRALQTHSTQIRLWERGDVLVSFADEAGNTRAEIQLPAYVWLALRNHILDLARSGVCIIDGEKRKLSAELRCAVQGETLELSLEKIN